MAESVSVNGVPPTTLEQKFAALEAKFASLENKYNDLHGKTFLLMRTSTDSVTEVAPAQKAALEKNEATPPEAKDAGPRSRAKILVNKPDPATGERKDQEPSDPATTSPVSEVAHAFTLRKNVYEDAEDNDGEIDIINLDLWELLKGLLRHYPYHLFQGTPVTIESPYEPFIFNWEKLEQATKEKPTNDTDKQARSDLRLLLDTISSASGDGKLDKYFKSRDSNREQKSVTFETLWTVFPPGTWVYGKPFQGQEQVFIVQDCARSWPHFRRSQPREQATWSLFCWTYDWDGKLFKRMSLRLEFEYFDGHKPITSLPFYPFELNEQHAAIKDRLRERGLKFRQYCTAKQGSRMFNYNGESIFVKKGFSGVQGDDDEDDERPSRLNFHPEIGFYRRTIGGQPQVSNHQPTRSTMIEGRVMVDFESYFRYGPSTASVGSLKPNNDDGECTCLDCRENDQLQELYRTRFDEEARQKDRWENEQYILCPPRVLGYILRDKQWAQLQVTLLQSIPEKDPTDSWSTRLKLADGEKTKNMILNLVKGHGASESPREDTLELDDIIARKGKGLVILLYGPPGVGKTSTAETVAIAARKPLFSISVADVGIKAKNVEANLAKIFALAHSWQAILLIDEADVFLESRGKGVASSTERNALVSVFLRVLEYYQGILMLTTNQIAQFDVAVQSRVHVAIKYVKLDRAQTMAIFEGFLNPLAERGLVKDMDKIREWLDEDVVKMGLDGRQIRNILTSALGLARAQGKDRLEKSDIKMMLGNVKDFKDEFIRQYESYKTEQQGMVG